MIIHTDSKKSFAYVLFSIVAVITVLFAVGFFQDAKAFTPPCTPWPSCSGMGGGGNGSGPTNGALCLDTAGKNVQGFTVAVVYCVRAIITDALTGSNTSGVISMPGGGYLGQIITLLTPYKWAAITLALTLFGVKLTLMNSEHLLKDSASLLFRSAIILFLIDNLTGAGIYSSPAGNGIYVALTDAADEMVSFVSMGFNQFTCASPPAAPAGPPAGAYKVWQEFDCIFQSLMNVGSDPATVGVGVGVGIVMILAAAFFSGALAVFLIITAITLFVLVLMTLLRAIYVILLSYFSLAILMLVAPLIIPLLVFDNKFVHELFWKWLGLISSIIFQPLFLIGFMSFAVMVESQFIDGQFSQCVPMPNASPGSKPALPAGDVCSINQLINSCVMPVSKTGYNCLDYNNYPKANPCDPDKPDCLMPPKDCCIVLGKLFYLHLNVQFKPPKNGCSSEPFWSQWACNLINGALTLVTTLVHWAEEEIDSIINKILDKITILVPQLQFPIYQLFITLICLVIVTVVFRDLLEVIPHMSQSISISVGIGLMQLAQVPLESVVVKAVQGAGDAMKSAVAGGAEKGMGSVKNMGNVAKSGASGAMKNVMKSITGR